MTNDKTKIGGIIALILVIFIVIAVIQGMSTFQEIQLVALENNTVTDVGVLITLNNDDLVSGTFTLQNDSYATIPSTNYTIDITTGILNLTDKQFTGARNWTYANYSYYPESYIKAGATRTLVVLLSLFLIVIVITVALRTNKKVE